MLERYACSAVETAGMNTAQLRDHFLIQGLFASGAMQFVYSHYDRMIVGGVMPGAAEIGLPVYEALRSSFFLERREMGIINIGGAGSIEADGEKFQLEKLDCLYLGRGTSKVVFSSLNATKPAKFFVLSAPAHQTYPNHAVKSSEATPAAMGTAATSNERTIYKYIHEAGVKSCQLVMGLTVLKEGSVWNTMPAHTHNRRMEVYLYFDVKEEHRVVHFMGKPNETRHLFVAGDEAVLSPPWSIHSGCGTASYSFIWGMAGENQSFSDMDFVEIKDLR